MANHRPVRRTARPVRTLPFGAPPRAWLSSEWAILPLRLFLGVTFLYAGLQKLANPNFFNASSGSSIQAQLIASARISPIHLLIGHLLQFAKPLGIIISLSEIAIGIGTCLLYTSLGRHDGPGEALDLWHHYEDVLDVVPNLGIDGIRLTLEWARLEPRPGEVNEAAYERYKEVIAHAHAQQLHVTVVLIDAAWPSWLGLEAWLLPWVVPYVRTHVQRTLEYLGDSVDGCLLYTSGGREDSPSKGEPWLTKYCASDVDTSNS